MGSYVWKPLPKLKQIHLRHYKPIVIKDRPLVCISIAQLTTNRSPIHMVVVRVLDNRVPLEGISKSIKKIWGVHSPSTVNKFQVVLKVSYKTMYDYERALSLKWMWYNYTLVVILPWKRAMELLDEFLDTMLIWIIFCWASKSNSRVMKLCQGLPVHWALPWTVTSSFGQEPHQQWILWWS